jgi:hypothetical protein
MKEIKSPLLLLKDYFLPIYYLLIDLISNYVVLNDININFHESIPTIFLIIELFSIIYHPSILFRIFLIISLGTNLFKCYVKLYEDNANMLKNMGFITITYGILLLLFIYLSPFNIIFMIYLLNRTLKNIFNIGI